MKNNENEIFFLFFSQPEQRNWEISPKSGSEKALRMLWVMKMYFHFPARATNLAPTSNIFALLWQCVNAHAKGCFPNSEPLSNLKLFILSKNTDGFDTHPRDTVPLNVLFVAFNYIGESRDLK